MDKDHVKGVQKMVQSIHDDAQTKHMTFQGSVSFLFCLPVCGTCICEFIAVHLAVCSW